MLAAESACDPGDFLRDHVRVVPQPEGVLSHPLARRYPRYEPSFAAVSTGRGAVITVSRSILPAVERIVGGAERDQVFQPERLAAVDRLLHERGLTVYGPYLRLMCADDTIRPCSAPEGYTVTVEHDPPHRRILALGPERWPNAISLRRDASCRAIAVAAYAGETVGVAAISADTALFWQIGIDVVAPFRGRGVGVALTAALARVALDAGRIPWYGVAPSNLASIATALGAGFRPRWVEAFSAPPGR